jgi:hypothetical protein
MLVASTCTQQRRGLRGLYYGADWACLTNAAARLNSQVRACVPRFVRKEKKRKGVCLPVPFENCSAFGEGAVAIGESENLFSPGSERHVSRL